MATHVGVLYRMGLTHLPCYIAEIGKRHSASGFDTVSQMASMVRGVAEQCLRDLTAYWHGNTVTAI